MLFEKDISDKELMERLMGRSWFEEGLFYQMRTTGMLIPGDTELVHLHRYRDNGAGHLPVEAIEKLDGLPGQSRRIIIRTIGDVLRQTDMERVWQLRMTTFDELNMLPEFGASEDSLGIRAAIIKTMFPRPSLPGRLRYHVYNLRETLLASLRNCAVAGVVDYR